MILDRLARRASWCSVVALLALALPASGAEQEKLPPNAKVIRIEAHPASIALKTRFEYTQVLVTAQLESGDKIDVTRLAQLEAPALVEVSPAGLVRPKANGSGELKCKLGDQQVVVPVEVSGQKEK